MLNETCPDLGTTCDLRCFVSLPLNTMFPLFERAFFNVQYENDPMDLHQKGVAGGVAEGGRLSVSVCMSAFVC